MLCHRSSLSKSSCEQFIQETTDGQEQHSHRARILSCNNLPRLGIQVYVKEIGKGLEPKKARLGNQASGAELRVIT